MSIDRSVGSLKTKCESGGKWCGDADTQCALWMRPGAAWDRDLDLSQSQPDLQWKLAAGAVTAQQQRQ
ncbi:unnamed protein product [Sphagnum tenellum]